MKFEEVQSFPKMQRDLLHKEQGGRFFAFLKEKIAEV